ncbi:developmental protein fluG [Paracoccidioides lutzii Pb01]|uniref:Glutamine synthetase n=1 Tax=Paracoccidioides lutzii (strain ATCC MYA-826 / Pb01) TaxID=502779 RepID=C1GZ99_PARBA|nr:developmental protein fluG [Paracoccidioides lutzii Pb01]EEH41922.1 developmental protein fluG [Paracoccidioides lutzii Pb01]
MADITALQRFIYTHPIIDNHAHNILKADSAVDYDRYPFEYITSEAQGESLVKHSSKSLAHIRAINQLSELFGCAPELSAIKSARDKEIEGDYAGLVKKCLMGTHMLLIDDGLTADDVEPYSWHDGFTNAPSMRIVRIETLAVTLFRDLLWVEHKPLESWLTAGQEAIQDLWNDFRYSFSTAIENALDDPAVVGFKSVICYRTGLKIQIHSAAELFTSFQTYFRTFMESAEARIEDKPFNDYLVISVLEKLSQRRTEFGTSKPIQFHTGLGDSDIILLRSNPAHLQKLMEDYPNVDFVLLHSSYPYTREAGYLASVYANVYLDIGEVFPMISRDAQISILRQSLELVPTTKLLWSTDGHYHPENFWLANKQFRQALDIVFTEYVNKGDYTYAQAIEAARDIMFSNSNCLYNLNQSPKISDVNFVETPISTTMLLQSAGVSTPEETLKKFLHKNSSVDFIWMQWIDYTATLHVRIFPVREFNKIVTLKRTVGITLAVLNMLQTDQLVPPDARPVGQFILTPDLTTLCRNIGLSSNSATVMTFWRNEAGGELEGCPRTILQSIANKCQIEYGIETLIGFEIEVVFLKPTTKEDGSTTYSPWLTNHSWSGMTSETVQALPLLEKIADKLKDIDIRLEQFHAESCPSQFEFILPPSTPLAATDTLIKARQTITNIAAQHGLRATLYPRPYPFAAGTAAHTHISITPSIKEDSFLAGMLLHLPSVLAFTFPQEASYARVAEGVWAGGVWLAWGYQNRETPIRKISPGHWEVKSVDGLANPYLGVAAIICAGYLGLKARSPLEIKGCDVDTAILSPSEREALSITTRLPSSLDETLEALEGNIDLQNLMGRDFVRRYIGVRRGEQQMLNKMSEDERRNWLIERY